jgi:hypothetical protein
MIQELTPLHYLGVLCSRCEERIPVPNRAAAHFKRLELGEASGGQDVESRAFTLRCKACDGERVYRFEEVREFEGKPRIRTSGRKKAATAS